MRIVILGAGALGSIAAAHLARAGVDVALIARGPRALLLREQGIEVRGLDSFRQRVQIVERAPEMDACDAFVLTAKTYDTSAALQSVRWLKAGVAFSLQNGLVKDEQLAGVFGQEHTLGCIANYSGELQDNGTVLFTRNEGLYIGEMPAGASPRVQELVAVFEASGIHAIASETIRSVEWSKFVAWLGVTAVSVLSRFYTHYVYQDPDLALLHVRLIKEASKLAAAAGEPLVDLGGMLTPRSIREGSDEEGVERLRQAGREFEERGVLTHRMSALQDLLRGRRLEVEETYGWALRLAREQGIDVPALDTCYRLLAALDRGQTRQG